MKYWLGVANSVAEITESGAVSGLDCVGLGHEASGPYVLVVVRIGAVIISTGLGCPHLYANLVFIELGSLFLFVSK